MHNPSRVVISDFDNIAQSAEKACWAGSWITR